MTLSMTTVWRLLGAALIAAAWWSALHRPGRAAGGSLVLPIAVTVVLLALLVAQGMASRRGALRTIGERPLPAFLRRRLAAAYPQLDGAALAQVERALRQFFGASLHADGRYVAMPSKVVDALWHEFILSTRHYEAFCRAAFGRLLHHTPAEALSPGRRAVPGERVQRDGLGRAWYWACRDEGIDPKKPSRLPLLFALDAALAIPGGYVYALDCMTAGVDRSIVHCAGDLGRVSCGSGGGGGDGGSSGDGPGSDGAGGHGGGDDGGDGGGSSGCGGGGD